MGADPSPVTNISSSRPPSSRHLSGEIQWRAPRVVCSSVHMYSGHNNTVYTVCTHPAGARSAVVWSQPPRAEPDWPSLSWGIQTLVGPERSTALGWGLCVGSETMGFISSSPEQLFGGVKLSDASCDERVRHGSDWLWTGRVMVEWAAPALAACALWEEGAGPPCCHFAAF